MKTKTAIDGAYIKVISQGMYLHSAARKLVAGTGRFLWGLVGVRRPDEWTIDWTGFPEFRWHDGGEDYRDCKREVTATVVESSAAIHGRLTPERFSGREDRTSIQNLTHAEAAEMLRLLLGMIDRPLPEKKP